MTFAEILKYLREEREITQKELAAACKLSPQCICNLEQGVRNPTGSTVAVLATFFGVSADYLLGLENDFGAPIAAPMGASSYSSEERELVKKYRQLSPDLKQMLFGIIRTWTGETVSNKPKKA